MSAECHPEKLLSGFFVFSQCVFFSQVSQRHPAASSTDFARILMLIMSAVKNKLNVAMSKPGETSISWRTPTADQIIALNFHET